MTEAWLACHRGHMTVALLAAAVFVRLILCLQIGAGPLPRLHALVVDSDNHFFDVWGRRVASGDLLQAEPLHPMTAWMRDVARSALSREPELPLKLGLAPDRGYDAAAMETMLWDHWLRGATYFQEPAYPYLVGLTYRLLGPDVWNVFAWQLALGVGLVLVVHRLARRAFSDTAALAAGALAVLAPIPLFYEVTLLRDGLVAFATVGLALAMQWAVQGGRRRWLVLGALFGAAALVKQSFLFFPALMALWRVVAVRTPLRDRLAAAGLVVTGMTVALLPAILRNLAVGAPALAMNGSATAMLAVYHTVSASPFDLVVGPEYARVLTASDGRFVASLVEAARTHASAWGFAALNARKLLYAWHGFESPNNVDFYIFKQGAPLLAALPATFVVLLPLAAVGLASRRAGAAWPILVAALASLPTLLLAAVHSRYRAPLAGALLPLAGAGVARLASWLAARRWASIGGAAGSTALYIAWATASPAGAHRAVRARTDAWIGVEWLTRAEPSLAALYLQESLRLAPGDPKVEARLGQALLACGNPAGGLRHVEAAGRSLDTPAFRELHARALAAVGRNDEAIARARAALAADPGRVGARALLDRLEHRPSDAPVHLPREATP